MRKRLGATRQALVTASQRPKCFDGQVDPRMTRVLVAGVARSGTSWVAEMLASTEFAGLVSEPDDALLHPFAARAKRRLPGGQFPVLSAGDEAPDYEVLWQESFGSRGSRYTSPERIRRAAAKRLLLSAGEEAVWGAPSTGGRVQPALRAAYALAVPERPPRVVRNLIAKSVTAPFSVEWVAQRTGARVVVVSRDVRSIISSWISLGWISTADELSPTVWSRPEQWLSGFETRAALMGRLGIAPVRDDASPVERLTWLVALSELAFKEAVRAHPDWELVRHEELCADPASRFPVLAANLGLTWTERSDAALASANRPGTGLETRRVASELAASSRTVLTPEQDSKVDAVLEMFPTTA